MSAHTLRRTLVRDVMSTAVVSVTPDATFDEVAHLLVGHRVRAVPVLDDGRPVGVVSEADLARTAELGDPSIRSRPHGPSWRRHAGARPTTAAELMSSPAICVRPDVSVAEASRLMRLRGVGWLAVVDPDEDGVSRLVGVLGRSDVLGVFFRDDDDLRTEVTDQVFRRILLVDPSGLRIDVHDGVVSLAGEVPQQSDAKLAVALVSRLEGVVAVEDRLTQRFTDASDRPLPMF
ncbi:CBS domain-containing protein [Pseudonocardia sp. N23]|uniref:CBS domain-containing protein n=1 Tax=Pseudonocardia sp. N23 TaxID=1987376 RepID=UPI000BFCB0E4|nr:CBS domain-containing protein [Pseudonocardia sp. N23]GAY07336.1 CBS domain protein [Pseudonocardia sp. N23]